MNGSILLRAAGLLAVLGGVLNGFADYLLQGGLVPRAAVNTYENLATVPYEMVFWGSIIGNAAIPLWLLGFGPFMWRWRPPEDGSPCRPSCSSATGSRFLLGITGPMLCMRLVFRHKPRRRQSLQTH